MKIRGLSLVCSLLMAMLAGCVQSPPSFAQVATVVADCGTIPTNPATGKAFYMDVHGNLCTAANVSATATITGFPGGATTNATPMAVTTSSSPKSLPAGTSVNVFNTGSNTAFVQLGASATTAGIAIPPNSGCVLNVGSATQLAAITATGSTSLNLNGGANFGSFCYGGGGSSGGGSGGSVTVVSPIGSQTKAESVAVTLSTDEPPVPVNVNNDSGSPVPTQLVDQNGDLVQWGNPTQVTIPYVLPSSGTISAADSGSSTTSGQNSTTIVSGTPTANSAYSYSIASTTGATTACFVVSGTWTGTLVSEISSDSGATFEARTLHVNGTSYRGSSFTGNGTFCGEAAAGTTIRLRATALSSGSATVKLALSASTAIVKVNNPIQLWDNASGQVATIKAASTAAQATDTAQVVGISPNSNAVVPTPTTANGLTSYGLQSAASTNSTSVATGARTVYAMNLINTTTTIYYLRIYDAGSAPTCSSATGFKRTWPIPPASAAGGAGGIAINLGAYGTGFSSGIAFCLTGGPSSTDNTNAATGVFVNLDFK